MVLLEESAHALLTQICPAKALIAGQNLWIRQV
eukprot:CAMPEP_0115143200 /NCGR_PEP_ID=MMETSP0227-20121206/60627_1 /TAXON_ID=89957 /ORGANISM="Polarella glacialis, Strain CCMP 1383" /LENGTH=32 /DNA_ID= /DNA_START= /DNA_END= /DNA_ORIENTATION=